MITHFRHTGIVVADLDASLQFYVDTLGFSVTKRMEETGAHLDRVLALEGVQVTTVKMAAPDGFLIELLYYQSHQQPVEQRELCTVGIGHIALQVDDIEAVYAKLMGAGVHFNAEPQTSPDGYAKLTFCQAPEGTFIELVQVLGGS